MLRALLALAIVSGCGSAAPHVAAVSAVVDHRPVADMAYEQVEVIEYMLDGTPAADTEVVWLPCWQDNAFFYPPDGPVVLCLELGDDGVFTAAHEAGHALIRRMGMDPDGPDPVGDYADERAADDLATLFLIEMDKQDEALEGVRWFMAHPLGDDGEHPAGMDRAKRMLCLLDGADGNETPLEEWDACNWLYIAVWNYWAEQFVAHMPAAE